MRSTVASSHWALFCISLWFYRSKVSSRYAKIIIEQQNADIRSMNVQLDQMAHTDELTGMKNRRSLERLPLDDRWNEMPPVSAMMVDIDFFQAVQRHIRPSCR